jgi:hypothetical protein
MPALNVNIIAGVALTVAISLRADTIPVYLEDRAGVPAADMYRAKNKAAAVFVEAGVRVAWRNGTPRSLACGEQPPILVRIISNDHAFRRRAALAFALPYEGVHITVLYERVRAAVPEAPAMGLAYVLVHEITHILQGMARHSETGLMRARWDWADHHAIRWGLLGLSPQDIELIHVGLAARAVAQERLLLAVNRDTDRAAHQRLVPPDRLISPD